MEVGERLSLWVRKIFSKTRPITIVSSPPATVEPQKESKTLQKQEPALVKPTQTQPEKTVVSVLAKKSREEREREYTPLAKPAPKVSPQTPSTIVETKAVDTEKKKNLHPAFKEVTGTDKALTLGPNELPWLDSQQQVKLNLVTLQGSDEKKFYYGSVVRGRDLVKAAQNISDRNLNANNSLYAHLPDFIRFGHERYIRTLEFPRTTEKPIYCVSGNRDTRSYFMQFDNIDQIPVIIRIATCHKADQGLVMKHISTVKKR